MAACGLEDHQGVVLARSARTAASEVGCDGVDWSVACVDGVGEEAPPEKRFGRV